VSAAAPFDAAWPIVGMVHLPPLSGSPRSAAAIDAILESAMRDAARLVEGGVDGVLVENYGDTPFAPGRVPAVTVAAMAIVVRRLVESLRCPVGVNVLRNDGRSALEIAAASGARFVRVNVLAGVAVAGEGLLRGMAHELLRARRALGADVAIWADLRVKHAAPLAARPLEVEARELVERAGADVVVLSGGATGTAPDRAFLDAVRRATPSSPRVLGSGLTAQNAGEIVPLVDGAIVGTSVKEGGETSRAVSPERVRALVAAVALARRGPDAPRRGPA
jgi:hypothetical protein